MLAEDAGVEAENVSDFFDRHGLRNGGSIVAKPLSVAHTATLCTMLVHVGRTAKRDGNPQGGVYQAEEGGARAGAARAAGAPRRALDWRWNQG